MLWICVGSSELLLFADVKHVGTEILYAFFFKIGKKVT